MPSQTAWTPWAGVGSRTFTTGQGGITTPYTGPVATRTKVYNNFLAGTTTFMTRTLHVATAPITSLQIGTANWYLNASFVETAIAGASSVTAAIEYPLGTTPTQILYSGIATGSIPSGQTLISDAVSKTVPQGAIFAIRMWFSNASGIPYRSSTELGMPDGFVFPSAVDHTMDNTAVAATGNTWGGPCLIIGTTTAPTVGLLGDSICAGTGDNVTGNTGLLQCGYLERSLPGLGIMNCGVYGDRVDKFLASSTLRRALVSYCSHIISEYGFNDISGGRTPAQVLTDLTTLWNLFPTKKVAQCTITPKTTSTDSWATIANQTLTTESPNIVTLNTSLRLKPAPLDQVFDVGAVYESNGLNGGKWLIGYSAALNATTDGIHPNTYGHGVPSRLGVISPGLIVR